ncbi:MAG TPA: methylenetetrahydrofolate reductase [Acidimicrobiales bacterium]|nr:methylenetetrahydrofolate reductase [Acidimicrobiales bacterium]
MARIVDLLAAGHCFSMELWPPRNEAAEERLEKALAELERLRPAFVSITYGAGGSTRHRTHDLVVKLEDAGAKTAMAHLTCADHTRAELTEVITRYADAGVENLLALRGDPPLNATGPIPDGELAHAIELVELAQSLAPFCVAVAAHPEGHPDAPDMETDRKHLRDKLRVADFAITQFFFQAEDYFRLVDWLSAEGIDKPVLPGIMPITNARTVKRMAELSGSQVPPAIAARIEAVADRPSEVRKIGVEVATELCQKLLAQDVPGLHFYTMNESAATIEIYEHLGLAGTA